MAKQINKQDKLLKLGVFLTLVIAAVTLIVTHLETFGIILLVVLGFGAVVLIHEFGHFIVAKLSDIHVEAFSIGFSPVLFGIKKTENGLCIRILPGFFKKEKKEEIAEESMGDKKSEEEGLYTFTIGGKCKAGETEYRIGLIPFGGFVKMLGQEDTKTPEATDDPRSYANKSVHTRMAVIAAGVVFNIISAIIIFITVFTIGVELNPPVIGGVAPDSPAARAGLEAGDEVIAIDGKGKYLDFSNIQMAAALSDVNEAVKMKIKKSDGVERNITLIAEVLPGVPVRAFGVVPAESLTVANVDEPNIFAETGLQPGDIITAVNGEDVTTAWQMQQIISNSFKPQAQVLAQRNGEKIQADIPLEIAGVTTNDDRCGNIYSIVPRLKISFVNREGEFSANKDADIQPGDVILVIADQNTPTFPELRKITTQSADIDLPIKVLRTYAQGERIISTFVRPVKLKDSNEVQIGIAVALDGEHPVVADTVDVNGFGKLDIPRGATIEAVDGEPVSNFFDCLRIIHKNKGQRISIDYRVNSEIAGDVAFMDNDPDKFITVACTLGRAIPFKPLERIYKATGPLNAVEMGYQRTIMFITQAYVTIKQALVGNVSPKNFVGPIGIAHASFTIIKERSLTFYVYFMGLISAFIAVFNFLPMLPFDGGHIVMLAIEKIKGSPVDERVQGAVTYVGLGLVLILFLYVTFNDVVRLFTGWF
ncbi:MAG: site-2 protease family protein [Phycisphaerae bacterium]|nr:site-2 protease family protein [Phycisphaerae bacterium]